MVAIDTDVLLLEFAFQSDPRQTANAAFLEQVRAAEPAITVYNVMELLGQLSFNLAPNRLDAWHTWLLEAYHLNVISPVVMDDSRATIQFVPELIDRPYAKMRSQRMGYMDALVLGLLERTPDVGSFVAWNARHFKGKTPLPVVTPVEYLRQNA